MLNRRNPLSFAALTAEEVRKGMRFKCYTPENTGSVLTGTFISEPRWEREVLVVDVEIDNESIQTSAPDSASTPGSIPATPSRDMAILGIMPHENGEFDPRGPITIELEADAE